MMKIRNMTAAVADAMAAVSLFVKREADDEETLGGCRFERDIIRDNYPTLKEMFYEVFDLIREDWNTIIGNDLLLNELKLMLEACNRFHTVAGEFEEMAEAHDGEIEDLFGEDWRPIEYLLLICYWEKEANAIYTYCRRNCGLGIRLDDPFRGIALRLRKFFNGVTDDDIREFVMNGVSLAGRPRWIGDKNQAVVMGKMLGKSCKEMNESFMFTRKDGTPEKLHYLQHGPRLEFDQYEIYGIIKLLQDATSKKNG